MLTLETARLLYVTTPADVMRERLRRPDFDADIPLSPDAGGAAAGSLRVHFPEEWPGDDALVMFPRWLARQPEGARGPWADGIVVRREDGLAAGSMGFRAAPDPAGSVELGYAVNRSLRGRGYATEMAAALTGWALAQPGVRRVTAECLAANAASKRVLEKVGFTCLMRRPTDDGTMLGWRLTASAGAPSAAGSGVVRGEAG